MRRQSERRKTAEKMLIAGVRPKEISEATGYATHHITLIRSQIGIPPFSRGAGEKRERNGQIVELVKRGKTLASVGKMFGLGRSRVFDILHPEQNRARVIAAYHVKHQNISKINRCQICGDSGRLEKHHHSYDRPADVIFLCPMCHDAADRQRRLREKAA